MKNKAIIFILISSIVALVWSIVSGSAPLPVEREKLKPSGEQAQEDSYSANITTSPMTRKNESKKPQPKLSGIALRQCRNIPKTEDELDSFLTQATEKREPFQYIEDIANKFELCSRVSNTEQNYIQLLIDAANEGSIDSLNEIWKIPETEYFDVMKIDSNSKEDVILNRKAFAKTKYRLAEKLALNGNEEAVLKLVAAYQHYDPVEQRPNYVKSLGYADFGLQTTQDNEYYLKLNWFKQRMLSNSSQEEVESASSITEQLLKKAMHHEN